MKLVEAHYEKGVLRPTKPLPLRSGERVNLIIVRQPDPKRWDLERFRKAATTEDLDLAEDGLASWSASLDEEDQ
ncbi:MAG TPA: antitoxin family protein [Terriglobia bacterium]|jgi:predicted DNA-binding antitoxin AbrB/MazE fold protein